tara:strand:- start:337 stop:885 length:549 start_codon:yes stop_codon:yes gene_type:complete
MEFDDEKRSDKIRKSSGEFDEKIHTHLVSVWRESKSLFGVGGKEGMLFLTDNHFVFLRRTERMKKWWKAAVSRQVVTLLQNKNTILRHDGYSEEDLDIDLQDLKEKFVSKITFDNILEIEDEEKTWGSVLKIKAVEDGKKKEYQFSIVQDWVNYPIKDPTKYLKVDWKPCVEFIKSRQRITK